MTKEITKAFILQEMQDKFKLRELMPEKFSFSEQVLPVYNVEQHLLRGEVIFETREITGTGSMTFFTIPDTEKWQIHRYVLTFMTGVFTSTGVLIGRPTGSYFMYLDLTAGVSTSYLNDLPKTVLLNPGDTVCVNIDGYTSTGNLRLYLDVTKETIR